MLIYTATYESFLGSLTLYFDKNYLISLATPTQACEPPISNINRKRNNYQVETYQNITNYMGLHRAYTETIKWLDLYMSGKDPGFYPPLKAEGTPFRQLIWKKLLTIPYGQLVTYGDLAKEAALELGKEKMSAQAVGGAVGHNPIPIIIPCHRVIGAHKALTGYTGGIDVKVALLELEHIDTSQFIMPK